MLYDIQIIHNNIKLWQPKIKNFNNASLRQLSLINNSVNYNFWPQHLMSITVMTPIQSNVYYKYLIM